MAERAPIRGTSLYLVLLSNGLHRSKNFPAKFGFSLKTVPINIAKKLPPQRCSKPLFIPIFNFSHKRPTFAFTVESGYILGFQRKIAHNGSHGETGAFPPSDTAGLCAASEIALSAAFVTLDSAMLLYQQQLYYAAQRQAGNISTARRGCGESAGAADDHAAKEYGAT